jgi:predicted aspartyl protease/Flp pilus assembly protein TadD
MTFDTDERPLPGPDARLGADHGHSWRNVLSGMLLLLGLSVIPDRSWAACQINALEMPVMMVDSRAVATLGIKGSKVPMIVDSGAFYSFLTHAAAQQLQLEVGALPMGLRIEGLTGEVEAGRTTVKQLQLLGGVVPDIEFIVGGNGQNGTMGLLGRNILAIADVEYDLAHGAIRLMVPNDDCDDKPMAYWAGDKTVSELTLLRDETSRTPAIQAIAQLNGKKLRVLFDTGARSLVSLRMAKQAGAEDLMAEGKIFGAGSGDIDAWTANFARFEIGGEAVSNVRLDVADFDRSYDMLIGIDFFLSHRIYISKKQRRMYFTYNGGTVFARSSRDKAASIPSAPNEANANSADAPKDAAAYARRGAASAQRQDFARALADLDRACAMAPQVPEYFVRRGVVHTFMQQEALALRDFDQALQLDPAQSEARLRRAWLRASKSKDREGTLADLQALNKSLAPQAYERLELARLYERLDLEEYAIPQWDLWINAHPHDVMLANALNARCWARTMLNIELGKALDDCDQAIDLASKNGSYYDSRAWLRLRQGELRKALADYESALKLRPNSAWSLYGRGIVRRKLGEAQPGQADIEAARKLTPSIDAEAGRHGLSVDAQTTPVPTAGSTSG